MFICLFVCPEHNSKTNDPKVFKLGIWNDLGIPRSGTVLGSKVKGTVHRVSKFISQVRTLHTRTAIHRLSQGGVTSCRRGIELGIECLLVKSVLNCCNRPS